MVLAEPSQWTQAPRLLSYLATPSLYDFHEPPRTLYEPGLNQRFTAGWRRIVNRFDPLARLYRSRARQVDRDATRAARRVLVNSLFTGEQLRRIYGIEPRVVYHGVDVELFRPGPFDARRREVLSVGSIQPSSGRGRSASRGWRPSCAMWATARVGRRRARHGASEDQERLKQRDRRDDDRRAATPAVARRRCVADNRGMPGRSPRDRIPSPPQLTYSAVQMMNRKSCGAAGLAGA